MSRSFFTPGTNGRTIIVLARFRELGILLFLVLLIVVATLRSPGFLTGGNLANIAIDSVLLLIVAVGEALLIIARQIDLSVGSMIGVCGITVGFLLKAYPGLPIPLALLVGIALGMLLGAGNGLIVTVTRVPAIITTLGTLSIYRGLAYLISGTQQVNPQDLPPGLLDLARTSPLHIPWLVIFAVIVLIAFDLFLRLTRQGRRVYAIGSNPEAAALHGIRKERLLFLLFVLCGALSGLAGVFYASRYATVNPDAGSGFELQVVAAVVIGGINILGGMGSIPGVLLGCLLLGTISNVLALLNVSEYWQQATQGAIILLAVATDTTLRQRLQRALMRGIKR